MIHILESDNKTEIKYVYHLSDIHIRLAQRIQEYTEVFDKTANKIQSLIGDKANESLIIVTGDILHNKTEMSSESTNLLNLFLGKLLTVSNVIIIAGNHDCNINNASRTDALTPFIRNNTGTFHEKYAINDDRYEPAITRKTGNHVLYYLRKTNFYQYYNIIFGLTAVYDNTLLTADKMIGFDNIKQKNKYKIGLYHGMVNGSRISENMNPVADKISKKLFNGYDYVMLGDIHKFQFLNNNKTMAYAGSLIQQNHGESIEGHGFLMWNLKDNKKKHYDIPNDYGYCTVHITDGKMVDTKIPLKPRIRIMVKNTSEIDLLKIKNSISKKYDVQNLSVISVILDKPLANSDDVNIGALTMDDQYHTKKIRQYLISEGQPENIINHVINVHKKIYDEIISTGDAFSRDGMKINKNQYWEPIELRFSNLFSYGENNVIDFELFGSNQVIAIVAPNHTGKSAIIDIILFCLYDTCSRGRCYDIINKNKTSFFCSLKFKIGNQIYLIEKQGRRPKTGVRITPTTTLELLEYTDKGVVKKSLNGDTKVDTNKLITDLVGNYDDFLSTSVCLQDIETKYNFTHMTVENQMKFLQRILGIDVFYSCKKYVHDLIINKNASIELLKSDLNQCNKIEKADIDSLQNRIDKISDKIKIKTNSRTNIKLPSQTILLKYGELDEYNLESEQDISACIADLELKLKNQQSHKISASDIKSKITSLKKQINDYNRKIIDMKCSITSGNDKIEDDIDDLNATKKYIEQKTNTILKSLNQCLKKINYVTFSSKPTNNMLNNLSQKIQHDISKIIHKKEYYNNRIICVDPCIQKKYNQVNELYHKNFELLMKHVDKLFIKNIDKNEVAIIKNVKKVCADIIQHNCDKLSDCISRMPEYLRDISDDLRSLLFGNSRYIDEYNTWLQLYDNNDYIDIELIRKNHTELLSQLMCLSGDYINSITNQFYQNILQKCDHDHNILTHINNYKNKIIDMNNQYTSVIEKIDKYNCAQNNIVLNSKIKNIENKLIKLSEQLKNMKNSYDDIINCTDHHSKIENHIALLKKYRRNYIEWEIANNKYNEAQELSSSYTRQIVSLEKEFDMCKFELCNMNKDYEKALQIEKKLRKTIDDRDIYCVYRKLMSGKGLPSLIIKEYLPSLVSRVNNILSSVVDFSIRVQFNDDDSTKIKKNKRIADNKMHTIDIFIEYNNKVPHKIQLASGFEKFVSGIAFRMSLNGLSACAKPNFFIIDEGWNCMDSDNLANIDVIMGCLSKLYNHVYIISHVVELRDRANYSIGIDVINGYSKIYNSRNIDHKPTVQQIRNNLY